MDVKVKKGSLVAWSEFTISDDKGNEIVLRRPDAASLVKLLQSVLNLEVVEQFRCTSPDKLLVEELLEACEAMLDPASQSNGMPLPHIWEGLRAAITKLKEGGDR